MPDKDSMPEWVWVVTETNEKTESLYALEDEDRGDRFIPVFMNQEDGLSVRAGLKKREGFQYQVEAMRLALVAETARGSRMDICFLDGEGRIGERLTPMPDA
jgi:hypothetical protein